MKPKSIMLDILEMATTERIIRKRCKSSMTESEQEYIRLEEKFRKGLTEEQNEQFDELLDAYIETRVVYSDETFRQGMSFGIMVTAEAYTIGGFSGFRLTE